MKYYELNEEIRKLYIKVFDSEIGPENSYVKAAAIFHAVKASVSERAASELISKEIFNADAQIIIRSILNITINITYILNKDSEARAKLWANHAVISKSNLLKALLKHDQEYITKKSTQKEIDQVFEEAKKIKTIYKYKDYKPWSNKSIRKMAKDVKLVDTYDIIYASLSDIEHTNANSADNYIKVTPQRWEVVLKDTVMDSEMLYSLMGGNMLTILSCLLKQYDLPELMKEFETLAENFTKKKSNNKKPGKHL